MQTFNGNMKVTHSEPTGGVFGAAEGLAIDGIRWEPIYSRVQARQGAIRHFVGRMSTGWEETGLDTGLAI